MRRVVLLAAASLFLGGEAVAAGRIVGQAFGLDDDGVVCYAAGMDIELIAVTPESEAWWADEVLRGPIEGRLLPPVADGQHRFTIADAEGRFTFDDVPAGAYFLWTMAGPRWHENRPGRLMGLGAKAVVADDTEALAILRQVAECCDNRLYPNERKSTGFAHSWRPPKGLTFRAY
jgi:hypothetical protein